jgi:intergrase/recombinase
MAYKQIKSKQTFEENPFVENSVQKIVISKRTQIMQASNREITMVISDGDGEVQGYSAFMKFIEVDEEKFAKVYLSQFENFWDLSKPAIRVFGYIINTLKPNQDVFYMKMDKCLAYTKYSQVNSIISGLSDLIDKEIIAKSKYENEYFINPLIVFNGSRVTFAKTYIKKKKESDKQLTMFSDDKIEIFESEHENKEEI